MNTTKPISEQVLQNALQFRFKDEVCGLNNAYVYYNESDYLSINNKGIATEVEIKISRSDFKADFKKPKHKQYANFKKGLKHWVRCFDTIGLTSISEWKETWRDYVDAVVINGKKYRHVKGNSPHTASSMICFPPISLPNRFYYLIPDGLISRDEVPEYAGLLYYKPHEERLVNRVEIIKRAPVVHKEKFNKWASVAIKLSHRIKTIHCNPQLKAI